jgi:hypothetical protein
MSSTIPWAVDRCELVVAGRVLSGGPGERDAEDRHHNAGQEHDPVGQCPAREQDEHHLDQGYRAECEAERDR